MPRPSAALFLIIPLFIAGLAIAGPFEDATKAFIRGDYKTAYRLFKPLAEQGNDDAQTNLGVMYEKGKGIPQDYAVAAKWYRKAAEQGNASAQFNLGLLFSKGRGVPQDNAGAAKWFRKAAEQGDADAQLIIGNMYLTGKGVPQDFVLAHMWLNLATLRYPESDAEGREEAEKNRDLAASKMTPIQIAEAQRLAREWKPKKTE